MIKHTEEFKQEAVRIALTSGLSRRRVASDSGVGLSTLPAQNDVFLLARSQCTSIANSDSSSKTRRNEG